MYQPAVMIRQIGKGRRDYVFPPLPASLPDPFRLCGSWAKAELVSRGMVCEVQLWRSETGDLEPMFSCPIFAVDKDGFGEEVEEWGSAAFFEHLKRSFAKTVNDALEKQGLPRSYEVL
jgi:hypothetical protein